MHHQRDGLFVVCRFSAPVGVEQSPAQDDWCAKATHYKQLNIENHLTHGGTGLHQVLRVASLSQR